MKCRICGNEKDNRVYEVNEMMLGLQESFNYFQCATCECLQIESLPQEMSKYYPTNYYSYSFKHPMRKGMRKVLRRSRDRHALWGQGFAGRLLERWFPNNGLQVLRPIPKTMNTKILDVGCGAGVLLHSLCEQGMNQLLGIDPFIKQDITYENGLRIERKRIQDIDGPWDIVMFNSSFAHIPDPLDSLRHAARVLQPAGYCMVGVPTVPCYAWDHYGIHWAQLDAPRHLHIYSLPSMSILAKSAGLTILKVAYHCRASYLWNSELYARGIHLRDMRSGAVCKSELANCAARAKTLDGTKQAGHAVFYMAKTPAAATMQIPGAAASS